MLDVIKEVLISSKKQELKEREEIEEKIRVLEKELSEDNFQLIDKELGEIEGSLYDLTYSFVRRVFNGKRIRALNDRHEALSKIKTDKIKKCSHEIELLLKKLHDLPSIEALIDKQIEIIEKANSLSELGMTEKEAMELLKNYFENDNSAIIKTVFLNIKSNKSLMTREDIFKGMHELYQTNVSPFVNAMKGILPKNFVSILLDAGIVIDEDKVSFLNTLTSYILEPSGNILEVIGKLDRKDRLDVYYYNEIEKALANMQRYSSYPNEHISYIMSLSALVSIAKTNKLEKKKEK